MPTDREPKRTLPPAQVQAFLGKLEPLSVARLTAEIALATGMRPGDVYALRRDGIDFERGLIHFTQGKVGRAHAVGLPEDLAANLRAYLDTQVATVDGLVFHREDGRACTQQTFRAAYRTASRKTGIDQPIEYFGVARNCLARWLADLGMSHEQIAQQLGHTSAELVARHYTAGVLPLRQLKELGELVAAALRGVKGG